MKDEANDCHGRLLAKSRLPSRAVTMAALANELSVGPPAADQPIQALAVVETLSLPVFSL